MASVGWVGRWKKKCNVRQLNVYGFLLIPKAKVYFYEKFQNLAQSENLSYD